MREMKDSGISWVGEIPKEWNKRPIRSIIKSRVGGVWGDDINDDIQGVVCIRIADFDFSKRKIKDVSSDLLTYRLYNSIQIQKYSLQKNDILIEKSGGGEKTPVGRAVLFDKNYKALFANFMDRIRIDDSIVLPVFAEYWLWNLYSCRVTPYYINQTIGIQNIDLTFMLAKEKICFPSLVEQQRIAEFLDRECGKIDGLKADIQAQIDTLEQYKRSVITEAVTHGLNPSAPMKDSGAGWMPLIPLHWKADKLKFHLRQRGIKNQIDKQVLSLYREYGIVPKDSRDDNHNVTSEDVSDYRYVRVGDFVVNKMKAWQGSVAVSNYEGIVSPAYFVYEFSDDLINKRYFHYLMRNKTYATEFRRLSGGIREGQWDLPSEALNNTIILLPPFDEQQEIADYLDNKCAEIELIIADKKSQIETLDGYKKSLIYEYVTGKKEVG